MLYPIAATVLAVTALWLASMAYLLAVDPPKEEEMDRPWTEWEWFVCFLRAAITRMGEDMIKALRWLLGGGE
jgi:hypothetical protein